MHTESVLPLDIFDAVLDHLAKEATRQRPLLEDDELDGYKVYLTSLLRLGASCRDLHLSSRRALWRSVDLDVSPRPPPDQARDPSLHNSDIHVSVVFPFNLVVPVWSLSADCGGRDYAVFSGPLSPWHLPVEHVRKLSILVYSSSRPGIDWQCGSLLRLLRCFPGPLRSVHIHGVTLPNPTLSRILLHLSPHLETFTLSQHGKVLLTESDQHTPDNWVYNLNHVSLPALKRLYFEAWLSLPEQYPNTSVQVHSLPNMPLANTVNVKARTVSTHLAGHPAFSNMFFWVKHWSDPGAPSASLRPSQLAHLGVFMEKDAFPFHALPATALDTITQVHVKAVVLSSASPFALLAQSGMPGLRDLTLTNFLAVSLARVPWTLFPNLSSLSLAADAEDLDRLLDGDTDHKQGGQLSGRLSVVTMDLPRLLSLSVSHVQLLRTPSFVLQFHCPQLGRLAVSFDPEHMIHCLHPPSIWNHMTIDRRK